MVSGIEFHGIGKDTVKLLFHCTVKFPTTSLAAGSSHVEKLCHAYKISAQHSNKEKNLPSMTAYVLMMTR